MVDHEDNPVFVSLLLMASVVAHQRDDVAVPTYLGKVNGRNSVD
jgi:hypothetical protein